MNQFGIAVHGGAGTIARERMTAEMEKKYLTALSSAVDAGYDILERGGSSLDAVEAAVVVLENEPLFNAGKGAVFNAEGKHELDAAIMEGKSLLAGAVAGVHSIKNPVKMARAVMEKSGHVLLAGAGAEEFARQVGIETAPEEYFFSEERYKQWQAASQAGVIVLDHFTEEKKFGTVGAVALDGAGTVAAATSTGGMTNKKFGRIGDTPVIGAGTYANNLTCAISCTGVGEMFIRTIAAYEVSALMEHRLFTLKDAVTEVVQRKLVAMDGEGGMIAIDKWGNIELQFNCSGMYRGMRHSNGRKGSWIF